MNFFCCFQPRSASARATEYTHTFELQKALFNRVMREYARHSADVNGVCLESMVAPPCALPSRMLSDAPVLRRGQLAREAESLRSRDRLRHSATQSNLKNSKLNKIAGHSDEEGGGDSGRGVESSRGSSDRGSGEVSRIISMRGESILRKTFGRFSYSRDDAGEGMGLGRPRGSAGDVPGSPSFGGGRNGRGSFVGEASSFRGTARLYRKALLRRCVPRPRPHASLAFPQSTAALSLTLTAT